MEQVIGGERQTVDRARALAADGPGRSLFQ